MSDAASGLRRPAPALWLMAGALAIGGFLGGCGGSSHSANGSSSASPQAQVTQLWTQFFSSKTSASAKTSMLVGGGGALAPAITALAGSPLAAQSSAQVTRVQLVNSSQAKVTYNILFGGKPALSNRTGVAVKSGGTWRISPTSLCSLLALEGSTPAACPKG